MKSISIKLVNILFFLTLFTAIFAGVGFSHGLKLYVIFDVLFVGSTLLAAVYNKQSISFKNGVAGMCMLFFFIWASITVIYTGFHKDSVVGIIKFAVLYSFMLATIICIRNTFLRWVSISIYASISAILISIIIFVKLFLFGWSNTSAMFMSGDVQSGNGIYSTYIYNVFYSFPLVNSQNYISSYLVTLVGVGLCMKVEKNKELYLLPCVAVLLSFPCILLSLSKTGIVGFFVLLIGTLIARFRWGIICAVYLVAFLLVNPAHISTGLFDRFGVVNHIDSSGYVRETPSNSLPQGESTLLPKDDDNSLSSRKLLWDKAFFLIKKHPIVGSGYRTTREDFANIVPSDPHVNHPHNLYLQVLVDLGAIGGMLFCGFLIFAGFNIVKEICIRKKYRYLNCLLLFICIFHLLRGFFGFQLEELDTWLLFALVISACNQYYAPHSRYGSSMKFMNSDEEVKV